VSCVNWNDANAYIEWLNQKTGNSYRLPTEAEWEYAARGETTSARFWGNSPDKACKYANVLDTNNDDGINLGGTKHDCDDGFNLSTAPVGRYRPNDYGLYDMLGNVWEWTCSKYDSAYGGAEKSCVPSNNRAGRRAGRGGSWTNVPDGVRSANRGGSGTDDRSLTLGFRLVLPE
jgi:formylglycine-generating enzyme required for sulfatase activity